MKIIHDIEGEISGSCSSTAYVPSKGNLEYHGFRFEGVFVSKGGFGEEVLYLNGNSQYIRQLATTIIEMLDADDPLCRTQFAAKLKQLQEFQEQEMTHKPKLVKH